MGRARSLGSTQQSVCLSCHDEHLSCPQSVWEKFFSLPPPPLEIRRGKKRVKRVRRKEGRKRGEGMRRRAERFQGMQER